MVEYRKTVSTLFETRRFGALLLALIFALFIVPLVTSPESEGTGFRVALVITLVAGIYASSGRSVLLVVAIAFVLPAALAWLGPSVLTGKSAEVARLVTPAACLFYTTAVVVAALTRQETVSRETLLGGINVYLLLAFAFALCHASIEIAHAGSYSIGGQPLLENLDDRYAGRGFASFVYFSVTTLSTLGFGDIVPVGESARLLTSAEALVGQLYLAIFIGRLVGLEVGERATRRADARAVRLAQDHGEVEGS